MGSCEKKHAIVHILQFKSEKISKEKLNFFPPNFLVIDTVLKLGHFLDKCILFAELKENPPI